jgi:excisionase family DNA binding protein
MSTHLTEESARNAPERRTVNLWPEAGKILGLSRGGTFAAAARGDIPTIRIGRRILVSRATLEKMLEARG